MSEKILLRKETPGPTCEGCYFVGTTFIHGIYCKCFGKYICHKEGNHYIFVRLKEIRNF